MPAATFGTSTFRSSSRASSALILAAKRYSPPVRLPSAAFPEFPPSLRNRGEDVEQPASSPAARHAPTRYRAACIRLNRSGPPKYKGLLDGGRSSCTDILSRDRLAIAC